MTKRPSTLRRKRWQQGMGKMPKGGLLTVVERAVVPFLPNGPRAKGHDHVEPTTTLPPNFESAGVVPLMEGNSIRGKAMWEAETREDGPP
uniref:Uncharacterized protein n=1 Tax=Oryza rufipogon TaxID=4529 RepID=A0A0E0Q4W4_ORYRU